MEHVPRNPAPDDPRSNVDAEAQRQKTALLYRSAGVAQSVNVVNAALLAFTNASELTRPALGLAWWGLVAAVAAGRYLLARRFVAAAPDAASAPVWRRRYVTGTAAIAAAWGAGAWLFMWGTPEVTRLFAGLVLTGMVAGAVPLLSPVPVAFLAFSALVGAPTALVVFLQADSALHWAFGAMSIVFLTSMLATARYLHETLDRAIRLGLEQRLLRAAVEQSSSSIVMTDADARIIFVNSAFTRTTGYTAEEVMGQNPRLLKSGRSPQAIYEDLWKTITSGRSWRGELCNKTKSGQFYWEAANISPIVDERSRTMNYLAVMDDITRRKALEDELTLLATTDPLTGVANRRRFFEELELELERHRRFHGPSAVLMVDIDHFKRINDTLGHPAGDAALQHLAGLARGRLRRIDLFARLGGEEFGILLPGTDLAGAVQCAENLRRQVEETPLPLMSEGNTVTMTVSIGVAAFDPGDAAADAVLARADRALYRAKQGGRNRVEADETGGT